MRGLARRPLGSSVLGGTGMTGGAIPLLPPVSGGGGGGGTIPTTLQTTLTFPAPSGSANDITMTFASPTPVGQFVDGSYFFVGAQSIASMVPAYSAGRHGYMVNARATVWNAPQTFDDRQGASDGAFSAPPSLPLAMTPGQSLVKVRSMATQTSYSWIQHAAVLTCLAAAPPVGTMRPAAFGTDKRLFSSANITAGLFPGLTASAVPGRLTAAECRARSQPFRCAWHPGASWGYYRSSADAVPGGKTWGGDVFQRDVELLCSLCLSHLTDAEKVEFAIAFAQHGIDTWGICVPSTGGGAGFLRGGGANGAGHLLQVAFAAWVTNDTTLKAFLSNASTGWANGALDSAEAMFWETMSFYRGPVNGVALWGKKAENIDGNAEQKYWTELSAITNGTIRDPYGYIDGGPIPGDSYQGNSSHQVMGLAALFDRLPGLKAVWPTFVDNANVLDEYGHRWASRGVYTLPDPVAPKAGTYGVNYGPNGSGSYIPGSGRLPSLDSTNAHGGNRFSQLTDDFYNAYHL